MSATLTGIRRYPVKSCRGQELETAVVEPWGLAGDRRWMLVDVDGCVVTARTHPRLVLVGANPQPGGLQLVAPGHAPLQVREPAGAGEPVQVWKSTVHAVSAGDDAAAWFSGVAGEAVRLVHLRDPTQRAVNPAYGAAQDRVSLADAYPLLLASEESLGAVNDLVATGKHAAEGPLDMRRFRPNLVVAGAAAWDEDGWRRVRVGGVVFRAVKACDRCVLTLVDPDTGVPGREPLATLVRHRRWDGRTWFAVNLIPDLAGADTTAEPRLRVGDDIEVLETVDPAEPQR